MYFMNSLLEQETFLSFMEHSGVPRPGESIRTLKSKIEGIVEKIEKDSDGFTFVFFETADGRRLKTQLDNVTVIEKLEDEELNEIADALRTKYKDSTAGAQEMTSDNFTPADLKSLERINNLEDLKAQAKALVGKKTIRSMKPEKVSYFYNKIDGMSSRMTIIKLMYDLLLSGEGNSVVGSRNSMSKNTYRSRFGEGNEQELNELSVDTMRKFQQKVSSTDRAKTATLFQLNKDHEGSQRAKEKIRAKTGDRRPNAQLREQIETLINESSFNPDDYKDILASLNGKKEPAPAPTKGKLNKVPSTNPNFLILYRSQIDDLHPVKWQVRSSATDEILHTGTSSFEKDAYNDAEDWIAQSSAGTTSSNHNLTLNFNAAFARQIGETVWIKLWEGPALLFSLEPQKGFRKTSIRTSMHARTPGAALLPGTTFGPAFAEEIGLKGNSRYTLGPLIEMTPGVYGCDLIWHSRIEKGVIKQLRVPSITVSQDVGNIQEVYQGPFVGDPAKLAKAPKLSLSGDLDTPLTSLVQNTIKTHGLKWAFNYYVKKHGLPPRHFKIYAGL